MKYLRKVIGLVIVVAFLASVIIGVGVIFSVKNVNVSIQSYSYSDWDEMSEEESAEAIAELNGIKAMVYEKYGGTMIGFVDEEELAQSFGEISFNGNNYILESCEKVYPCTLNITVKERREVFIVPTGEGKYSTYDSLGTLMRRNIGVEVAGNNLDNAPNVYVYGTSSNDDIVKIANAASVFADKFSSLRSIVERIDLQASGENIIFALRCGIKVHIADYTALIDNKIQEAYNKFITLTGEEKLSGTIVVTVRSSDGRVVAERLPDM